MSIPNIDLETATAIVQQIFPNAADPMLSLELEVTKGLLRYRPYIVAAKFIMTEYRRILKADVVNFEYDVDKTVRGLLNQQAKLDLGDTIPEGQTVEDTLLELCETCLSSGENYLLGVQIF